MNLDLNIATVIFLALAGALHVMIFAMESLLWAQPKVHGRFGVANTADAKTIAPFAYNQGFYNLFLAVGTLAGAFLSYLDGAAGAAFAGIAIFSAASMFAAALVLITSDKSMARPAIIQALFPAIALITLLF